MCMCVRDNVCLCIHTVGLYIYLDYFDFFFSKITANEYPIDASKEAANEQINKNSLTNFF